jgi:hypothetical protein
MSAQRGSAGRAQQRAGLRAQRAAAEAIAAV